MAPKVGTLTVKDLLEVADTSIAEFGENLVADAIQRDLDRLNARVQEQVSVFARIITDKSDRISKYGGSQDAQMAEADELGRPVARKAKGGVNVGFPMKKYDYAVGWTRDYMLNATPQDLALQFSAGQVAYSNRIQRELQRALYGATNYTFVDRLVDELSLPVKRLVNADSAAIPNGPNGETFDGATHTHYNAEASLTNANLKLSVADLTEHGHVRGVRMFINKADEAGVSGLADFKPLPDPRLTYRATDTATRTLSLDNAGDRLIGYFHEAEVWVKPWAIANYIYITALGDEPALKFRQHHVASVRGLRIPAQLDSYPLRADIMESYLGFGVWNRTNGVIHYFAGGTYAAPTVAP